MQASPTSRLSACPQQRPEQPDIGPTSCMAAGSGDAGGTLLASADARSRAVMSSFMAKRAATCSVRGDTASTYVVRHETELGGVLGLRQECTGMLGGGTGLVAALWRDTLTDAGVL